MNGRPFSTRRVPARRLLGLLPQYHLSLQPHPRVTRNLGPWKNFKLARNHRALSQAMYRRSPTPLLQFRSSRNPSPKKSGRSRQRPSLNKYQRLKLRRHLLRQVSPNLNWNRSTNSYWKRSPWSRRTTSGRQRLPVLLPRRSRKTPLQRHPRAAVLLPINSLPTSPTKFISSVSAVLPQGFRERCRMPSRRLSRSRRRPRRLASPARSRKCSTSFEPNWARWAEDEDLETHYNLGIAFREMGLLEEAISEFQKVAQATDRGRAFRYTMQCCTLLGLAFMDKGQPGVAAIWYDRALLTPNLDPESILALRYDLGVAQESAGEPDAALKTFSQVYAMNIDYRDVGERIATLQKPIR